MFLLHSVHITKFLKLLFFLTHERLFVCFWFECVCYWHQFRVQQVLYSLALSCFYGSCDGIRLDASIGTNDDLFLLRLCQDAQLQVPAYGQEVELYGNLRCPDRGLSWHTPTSYIIFCDDFKSELFRMKIIHIINFLNFIFKRQGAWYFDYIPID